MPDRVRSPGEATGPTTAATDSFDAVMMRIARLSHVPLDREEIPPLERGTELCDGRFVVERVLGRGGMGTVYEALDTARGARVALKSIGAVDAPSVHRFKREFRALSDVVHPSLVRLHERSRATARGSSRWSSWMACRSSITCGRSRSASRRG